MSRLLKSLCEHGLLVSGLPRISQWRHRTDVLILAYHNIVPHGAEVVGDRSLHLPQAAFAAQLDLIRATHDVISLDEALARRAGVGRGRAAVAITFDDAYRGAVTAGVAELARRGMPGTIFVPPAFLNGGTFWWDLLVPQGAPGLPADEREHALTHLEGKGTVILERASAAGRALPALPDHARGASEDELRRAAMTPGITLASHTWSHPNLAALAPAELEAELVRPLRWLRERFTTVVPYLSFPYGRSSAAVERAARAAGYQAALRIDGGWVQPGRAASANPYALPRLDVPSGVSLAGFRLRTAGLLS